MNSTVILLGHGSRNSDSQHEFNRIGELVQRLEPYCTIEIAYLQLCEPDLTTVLDKLLQQEVSEVLIIPVFLFAGNHIQVDIPAIIAKLKLNFPGLTIKLGRHLGPDPVIAKTISERIREVVKYDHFLTKPEQIESRSFQIIDSILTESPNIWSPMEREIVKRVIHTTADPEIAKLMDFHPDAVITGLRALQNGSPIITDVKMAAIGIGKKPTMRFRCPVECYIDDPEVAKIAKIAGKTRAMVAISKACQGLKCGIVVVGNAPTALFQLFDMIEKDEAKPDLIIGTPVGFVGAAESKEVLKNIGVPYIRTVGPRGGSPIAAAIVNTLCKLAEPAS